MTTHLPVFGTDNEHSALVEGTACQRLGIEAPYLLGLIFQLHQHKQKTQINKRTMHKYTSSKTNG